MAGGAARGGAALVGTALVVQLVGSVVIAGATWYVTIAAGVVAASPGVANLWRLEMSSPNPNGIPGDYFLPHGLVFLAIGLVGGAVAGVRPLVSSARSDVASPAEYAHLSAAT